MHSRVLKVLMALFLLANLTMHSIGWGQEKKPFDLEQVERLIQWGGISDERIIELLKENGLAFYPDEAAIARLTLAGASAEVIEAVRAAEHPPAPEKPPVLPTVEKEEKKKPFYMKWWFLGATAAVVGGTVALVVSGGEEKKPPAPSTLPDFPEPPMKR